jgi:Flp pilus assembly protein CpaB
LAVRGVGDDTLIPTPEIVFSDFIAETSSHPLTEETSLAFIVPEGYRAMAVQVDKVIGAGGLIRPGDRVDVLAVLEVAIQIQDLGLVEGSARAITLEQNVEVLAVEQALEDLAGSAALAAGSDADQPAAQPSATVVTLAVSPEVAQAIFLAEHTGVIRLAVRAPGEDTINDVPGTAFFSIRNQLGPVQLLTSQGYVDLLGS